MPRQTPSVSSKPSSGKDPFSRRLLAWYRRHGRHDLPWQREPTPYRVWVSEIMLQQTQVQTVVPYYERFMHRFPMIGDLAEAPVDEVLHLWSGLGYYARARHLHRTAQSVMIDYQGCFPETLDELMALPGIGRSTAGAILALAMGRHYPILDGNVKRVLCRYHGIETWPGERETERQLWELAMAHTPARDVAAYTQAIMDLGATVCTRARPDCQRCPVSESCLARQSGIQSQLPARRPVRHQLPVRSTVFILLQNTAGAFLLERRPPTGIWGGLWSLPECPPDTDVAGWIKDRYGSSVHKVTPQQPLRHTFSHFHLDIQPVRCQLKTAGRRLAECPEQRWYEPSASDRIGLPAPVSRLLDRAGISLK